MDIKIHPTTTASWQSLIQEALEKRNYCLAEDLESYLVFLLMRFTEQPALANSVLATEYLESQSLHGLAQESQLRDVGDKCLLFGGFYPEQAHKRLVSLEYFVNLGRGAYHQIASNHNASHQANLPATDIEISINNNNNSHSTNELFAKLAQNFVNLLDVLHQIKTLDKNNNWLLDEITKYEKQKLKQQEDLRLQIITNNNLSCH